MTKVLIKPMQDSTLMNFDSRKKWRMKEVEGARRGCL
jgi:hypothetical protein